MSKKMIQLDPKFMNLSKQRKTKTKRKKENLQKSNIKNTGALRKQLLNKIKDFQKNTEENSRNTNRKQDTEEDFSSEFNKSLQFLNNLTSKNKTHKKRSHISHPSNKFVEKPNLENIHISTELPKELLDDSKLHILSSNHSVKKYSKTPQYSCLKNGSKPTYREWKRNTQKNMNTYHTPISLNERELALQKAREDFQKTKHTPDKLNTVSITTPPPIHHVNVEIPNELKINPTQNPTIKPTIKPTVIIPEINKPVLNKPVLNKPEINKTEHRIKTTKYKLGKNKTHRIVGVLIKNRDTRKRVSKEKDNLKKKTILEVKNYLKKCNLLKTGSDAPPDVLRTMYEQAVLTGDVNNNAKDTLVHNYYNN